MQKVASSRPWIRAAIAYGLRVDKKVIGERNVIIFDFCVTRPYYWGANFEVNATAGVPILVQKISITFSSTTLLRNLSAKNKEGQTLSLVYSQISIDFYLDFSLNPPCSLSSPPHYLLAWSAPIFLLLPIHRNQLSSTFTIPSLCPFEELYQDIFCSTPDSAEEVLCCDSKIDKSNVPEIDLVSECHSYPRIVKLVSYFSSARNPTRASILMRLLSMGSAVQAAILCADTLRRLSIFFSTLYFDASVSLFALNRILPRRKEMPLFSLSIGIETAGGVMRNTTIPIKYPKFPSLTLTTNPVCLYRYMKASVLAPRTRTTISSATLNCLASLLHLVVSLSWSYLANGILWTCLPRTRRLGQESPTASLSLTTRVISPKRLIERRL